MVVYVFLADGFEEIEALTPIDLMRRADIHVVTIATGDRLEVKGAHGVTVQADVMLAAPESKNSARYSPESPQSEAPAYPPT